MASIQSADLIKERALIQRLRYLRDSFFYYLLTFNAQVPLRRELKIESHYSLSTYGAFINRYLVQNSSGKFLNILRSIQTLFKIFEK